MINIRLRGEYIVHNVDGYDYCQAAESSHEAESLRYQYHWYPDLTLLGQWPGPGPLCGASRFSVLGVLGVLGLK